MYRNRLDNILRTPVRTGILLACVFSLYTAYPTAAQTSISGVINQYARVKHISSAKNRIQVAQNPFAPGDKVLMIQMKGATINGSNTELYGSVTAINNAGNYEYNTVQSVQKDTVIMNRPFCRDFSPDDSVQLIKVPVYNGNVSVTGTLTCPPWGPGGTGGVLAFDVTDTLILQANIDVSRKGFRGGHVLATGYKCCDTSHYYFPISTEGMKGEGVAHYIPNQWYGCGNLANGGGGSSGGNSGGGGGGSYGSGGVGGYQFTDCYLDGCTNLQGMGGNSLLYQQDRIFMGGGGGGPQQDNGYLVFPGGNGGGIIIIRAAAIRGNGDTIMANGESIIPYTWEEGAPGGGGGGSIYLHCNHYTSPLHLSAKGGAGSSNNNVLFKFSTHGPGGGGGGGLIRVSPTALTVNVSTDISGGPAGIVHNPYSPDYQTTYGAAPGEPGAVRFQLMDEPPPPSLGLFSDTIVCADTIPVTLDIGAGYSSVQWSNGQTTPSVTVTGPGIWYVQAVNGCTLHYDTARITVDPGMTLGADTLICRDDMLTLNPQPHGGFIAWQWQDGSFLPQFDVTETGTYHLLAQSVNGCMWADTIHVSVDSLPPIRDTTVCENDLDFRISMPKGHLSYQWSNGAGTPSTEITEAGVYTVTVHTMHGCLISDTISVTVLPGPHPELGPDTMICFAGGDTLSLYPGAFNHYQWQDYSIRPYYTAQKPGIYQVLVTDENGCTQTSTIEIQNDDCNLIHLPNIFTPNGDGVNDLFRILGNTAHMQDVSFGIFDRWGQQVFFTDDQNRGWDGTCKSKDVATGTYVYLLRYSINSKPYLLKGNVHLVR